MSRRSQAHSIRTIEEVRNSNGTRSWTIAVHTPQTLQQRDPEKHKLMHDGTGARPKLVKLS